MTDPNDDVVIEGFSDYTIDIEGTIRRADNGKEIKWSYTLQGAPKVSLMSDDTYKRRTMSVKVLVAKNFNGEPAMETWDTPICLDGDPHNCHADNLVWRPRFFANLYSRQFAYDYGYYHQDEVMDIQTGKKYVDIYNAAIGNGLLFKDVLESVHNGKPCRCTHQRFQFVTDY